MVDEKIIIVKHYDEDGEHHIAGVIRPDNPFAPEMTVERLKRVEGIWKGATEYLVLVTTTADEYLKYNT